MSARIITENKIRYLALTTLIAITKASNDMTDNKVQIITNGENTQKNIDENIVLVDKSIPIDPNTGKPYFKTNENAWDGEWVAGGVQNIPSSEWGGDDE